MRFLSLAFLVFCLESTAAIIVLDPGHGGEEHGAERVVYRGGKKIVLKEKDLALSMAKKLAKILKKNHQVFLTRSYDRAMSLQERAQVADKVKADIFISIHLNASHHQDSHGFETFYLSQGHDETVRKVEQIENQGLTGEDLEIHRILIDLMVQKSAKQSRRLAQAIHRELGRKVPKRHQLRDRGMKPALFYVLALSKRPSVLLEPGFLSNKKEALKILSGDFQRDYLESVARGIDKYAQRFVAQPQLPLL